jgi:signal transduction histidine kinase/DNA-binding response OmpR family regulator
MNINKLFENCPLGICVLDVQENKHLNVSFVNSLFIKLFHIDNRDIIGLPIHKILSSEHFDMISGSLNKKAINDTHILNLSNGPAPRWLKIYIHSSRIENKQAISLWATDITNEKTQELSLRKAVTDADTAAEMKANFLATMSHEIRTPMQAIYGYLELIGEENKKEQINEMLATAKDSASGLLEILDDILDLAKIDANKLELDDFEVPIRTLVYGINEALSVNLNNKKIKLLDDIDPKVPQVVKGDPKRLRQILMNLTSNAIKFTTKGSVTIKVKAIEGSESSKGHLVLHFMVEDTGIGMNQEETKLLFKPFQQVDNSTSRKYGGTGLGLSICKKLVDTMGGDIGVESSKGNGSCFWFKIPTREVSTSENELKLPNLDGLSILSVEDHPQGAKEIIKSLSSMGAKVENCATIEDALVLAKRTPFDVGLIDQGLPDGLGIDLIKQLLDIRPYMSFVMYTVRDDIGLKHSLKALGVSYLSKPASRVGLGEAIADAAKRIERHQAIGSKSVLIVEDTESIRDVLERQFKKLKIDVSFAPNGIKALLKMEKQEYGIVITDLHMPKMDGYELIKKIRHNTDINSPLYSYQKAPVIVLTADVQMAQRQVYLSHGFDECLLKPVTYLQLKRLLIRWGLIEEELSELGHEEHTQKSLPSDITAPAIDIDLVKTQMGEFNEDTIEMLKIFIEMTEPLLDTINSAYKHQDFYGLREAAHSLKGASRSACCNVLGDIAAKLQDGAEAEDKDCKKHIEDIELEFERAKKEIYSLKI